MGLGDMSIPTEIPTVSYKPRLISYQGEALSSYYVASQWGEPDHRWKIDGGETWEYRGRDLRWHGVVPMFLFPLPLVVPFGHDYVTLIIQDGRVRSAVRTHWDFKFGFYCGYAMFASEMKGKTIFCEGQIK